jgi:hypothetical protein
VGLQETGRDCAKVIENENASQGRNFAERAFPFASPHEDRLSAGGGCGLQIPLGVANCPNTIQRRAHVLCYTPEKPRAGFSAAAVIVGTVGTQVNRRDAATAGADLLVHLGVNLIEYLSVKQLARKP